MTIQKIKIPYTLKNHKRRRSIQLAVHRGGRLVVTKPWYASVSAVERFIEEKSAWILAHIDRLKKVKPVTPRHTKADIKKYKEHARIFVLDTLKRCNAIYNFTWNKVAIRNQKSRWGSCSKKGNLNFNYKIVFLSPQLAEYIVVHELCHLGEFNHSRAFWALVARAIPAYKEIRTELKKISLGLG